MINILEISAFACVFEIKNNNAYFIGNTYQIFLNKKFYSEFESNVFGIYDLKPSTKYNLEIFCNNTLIQSYEFATIKCQNFINIKHFNAIGDGVCDDTSAINLAIYTACKGSTIYFPKGIYLVDQILLKSNIDFYFEKGCCIKQNTNRQKMAIIKAFQKDYSHENSYINTTWEGNPLDSYCSLIYAKNIKNVKIYGNVVLDGNGDQSGFWNNVKQPNIIYRPKNIELVNCANISIFGLKSINSSCWNMHTLLCKKINFIDLVLESSPDSPNTDGINPENSQDINILGCYFSVGDDCIAIKSGKIFIAKNFYKKTKRIFVRNCFMKRGHGGVVLGSEISCGAFDIDVSQCIFENTDRGIRIKTRRGRGSTSIIDKINVYNCKMLSVKHCLTINMYYNCDPDGKSDYVKNKFIKVCDDQTPTVKNIQLKNIIAQDIKGCAIFIYGLSENYVRNILIKDSKFYFNKNLIKDIPEMLEDFEMTNNLGIFIKNAKYNFENVHFEGNFQKMIY